MLYGVYTLSIYTIRYATFRGLMMDKSTYKRYLHTQQWQKLRFEVLKRAGGKCERCGYTPWKRGVLQVHHLNYDNVGHETADDLICVCARCHMELHGITGKRKAQDNKPKE